MQSEQRITEIVCLATKNGQGRPRVLKPGDFTDGASWERIVDAALEKPGRYEIHRETIYSEEQKFQDFSKTELREMTTMSRERVADIAAFYGVRDDGQGRAALIDQIAVQREDQQKVLAKHAAQVVNPKPVPANLTEQTEPSDLSHVEPEDLGKKNPRNR